MKSDFSIQHRFEAGIFNGYEGEIGDNGGRKSQCGPCTQIVSYSFHILQKIQLQQTNDANAQENGDGQKGGCPLDGFQLHAVGLNEKPEQLKAALALLSPVGDRRLTLLHPWCWSNMSGSCLALG